MTNDEVTDGALREVYLNQREPLPPADGFDPVIGAYKKDLDRALLRENLKLSVDQRARRMLCFIKGSPKPGGRSVGSSGVSFTEGSHA
jgi:hypothetical protein